MKKTLILGILSVFLMSACGSSKKTVAKEEPKTPEEISVIKKDEKTGTKTEYTNRDLDILKYIARYKNIAQREMKDYGIPASITIAQGILESQAGKSELATRANNHFGVKCHKDWTGPRYLYDDDEIQECFRKYENPERSYVDHSKFLANRKRYAFLFRLPKTDYIAWAKGLKKAGYATDPSYPDKLIYLINKYRLNELDKEVLKEMSIKVNETAHDAEKQDKKFIYEVKKGETIFTVSDKFNIPVKKIQQINNLNDFDIYEGQILVLTTGENKGGVNNPPVPGDDKKEVLIAEVEPDISELSSENAIPENERYTVKEGQTLFSIAKEQHIDINDLLEANQFDKSTEIKVGQVIRIPVDKRKNTANNPAGTKLADSSTGLKHTVKQGENIYSIARKYGVEVADLIEINNFDNSTVVKVGQVILIPEKTNKTGETKNQEKEEVNKEEEGAVYHIVKQGETLYRIHVNYGVPIKTLRKLNNLKGNTITVGQKIRVK